MSQYLKLYLITLAMFLAMDFVWLKIVARSFYQNQLGYLLADKVKYLPIVLFYLFFCAGVVYFVEAGNMSSSLLKIFLVGAFFGLLAYGAYDFTNWATVKNWPAVVVLVDMLWGAVVTGVSATVAVWLSKFV